MVLDLITWAAITVLAVGVVVTIAWLAMALGGSTFGRRSPGWRRRRDADAGLPPRDA
ncbi:MAG: hypothetical protein IPM29_12550 [Planctomycetes bacterium]|nr:hypothetical protein [Planctomycetota bacterium]